MCMDEIKNDWKLLEDKAFAEEIKCYRLVVNEKRYDIIGPIGTMHQIDKKSGKGNGKAIHSVASDPRYFLDNAKVQTVIVIPYGYWTCDCETGFVRTPYSSECLKCKCPINKATRRAAYLEDISFVS